MILIVIMILVECAFQIHWISSSETCFSYVTVIGRKKRSSIAVVMMIIRGIFF